MMNNSKLLSRHNLRCFRALQGPYSNYDVSVARLKDTHTHSYYTPPKMCNPLNRLHLLKDTIMFPNKYLNTLLTLKLVLRFHLKQMFLVKDQVLYPQSRIDEYHLCRSQKYFLLHSFLVNQLLPLTHLTHVLIFKQRVIVQISGDQSLFPIRSGGPVVHTSS